jgi:hypothetical protein
MFFNIIYPLIKVFLTLLKPDKFIITVISCVTEHSDLGAFLISDIAKRFYISVRIQTNLKDNLMILTLL